MTIQSGPAVRAAGAVPVCAPQFADPPFGPLAIAVDRCKGCGLCVSVCPKEVLVLDERLVNQLGHHPVRLTAAAACTSCALCARICPDAVFTVFAPRKAA
jgi:2-oxoglutarate ferredoxin oxidoreductase subunit delta